MQYWYIVSVGVEQYIVERVGAELGRDTCGDDLEGGRVETLVKGRLAYTQQAFVGRE